MCMLLPYVHTPRARETSEEVGVRFEVALKHTPRKQPILLMCFRVLVFWCLLCRAACVFVVLLSCA